MSERPRGPWLNLSVDFCGPLPTGEHFIVIDDENSRYPVVEKVRSTSADCVIPVVDRVFAMFGLPEIVNIDNGPPFQSGQWKKYMKSQKSNTTKSHQDGHKPTLKLSFNKPLIKAIRTAHLLEVTTFLRTYRSALHTSTLFTPFKLILTQIQKPKYLTLPVQDITQCSQSSMLTTLNSNVRMLKKKKRWKNTKTQEIMLHIKQQKQNKLSTPFNPTPMVVTDKKGSLVTAQSTTRPSRSVTRHSSHYHKLKYPKHQYSRHAITPRVISDPQAVSDSGMTQTGHDDDVEQTNKFNHPLPRKHHHPPQHPSEENHTRDNVEAGESCFVLNPGCWSAASGDQRVKE